MIKQRTSFVLDGIINDKNNAEAINKIDSDLLNMFKPHSFSGTKNIEINYNKQFEGMCILITQTIGINAKAMTVFEFYTAIEQIKKQSPKRK